MKYTATVSTLAVVASVATAQSSYGGCDSGSYYGGLNLGADRESLRTFLGNLLHDTHRGVWPGTNVNDPGVGDTWAALMDLDQGSFPGQVRLLYAQQDVDAVPFAGSRGWTKEQLFPINRGVGVDGVDLNDLHNLRPTTYLSDVVRGDKYFGECGILTPAETCVNPAEGGAEGTCTCNRIYTPPPEVRGDVARALMYMDVRYDGRDDNTLNLRLTDCPFQHERDMAYLSQMITWHKEDPPDDAERARNDKVCGTWQGNRNPFVDFPDLVDVLWDPPLPLPAIGERQIYEACELIPTDPPTLEPNQCELLLPGDIYFWLINSVSPPTLGLFNFVEMEAGFKLFMTTNPWDGEKFQTNQGGTVSLQMPGGGVDGGTAFGFAESNLAFYDSWISESGTFEPNPSGQPIFLYCLDNFENPRPLLAFLYGEAKFGVVGQDSYPTGESARPESLGELGVIKVAPGFSNAVFNENVDGYANNELKAIIRDPDSWKVSNDDRFGPASTATSPLTSIAMVGVLIISSWLL
ncbi:MAG: hypothetical protein SGBAC_007102 [Bacillariaceae sp.]